MRMGSKIDSTYGNTPLTQTIALLNEHIVQPSINIFVLTHGFRKMPIPLIHLLFYHLDH